MQKKLSSTDRISKVTYAVAVELINLNLIKTPQARFELATNRLTADRSTTELLRTTIKHLKAKNRIWQVV